MLKIIKKISLFFLDIIETGVIALSIFVIVYLFILQPHEVKGSSMQPNFEHGEFLITDKISYRLKEAKRGDVIVFKAPLNTQYDYIKRIIGLPEEKITIKDGKIFINDQEVKETYLAEEILTRGGRKLKENKSLLVPADHYFVMGDNRNHSSDSRDWGTVPKENIVGRVWFRYWPLDRFGKISQIKYEINYP